MNLPEGGGANGEGGRVDSGLPQGEPADIAHASTVCGTTACGIMGVSGSGFQELADVSFIVKDSAGTPVSGVDVKFELSESPPQKTGFLGDSAGNGTPSPTVTIKTDKIGKATARVQSGVTLGVFSVKATVSPTLQATSPAIGVRGVVPANEGFTLQCAKKNLAARSFELGPRPLKTLCTVTLVDRFNNPVGKPTTVNFKVEAGAIPSSVQSKAFNPTGDNADEGKASVDFSTTGTFPPSDVAPMAGEPFEGTKNQRDGLVTVLAYVAGEETFRDNNQNGKWDPGEQFIDQGEPFVDSNDNNEWDPNETYADVAPANGKYDPPNKIWDKQTTIWTTTYVLYSGFLKNASIVDSATSLPLNSVPLNAIKQMKASFSDDQFNAPESGAATVFAFSRLGTRGTATAVYEPVLDGYGFGVTRDLYDADNPSASCGDSASRCQRLTRFTFGPRHYLGVTVNIAGSATAGGAGAGVEQKFTFRATSYGSPRDHDAYVTFE